MCEIQSQDINNSLPFSIGLLNDSSYPNLSLLCPMTNLEDLSNLSLLSFMLEGVLQFTICCLGILGNILSIYILTRKELHSFFNQLLTGLVVFDLVYLFTMMLEALRKIGVHFDIQVILFPHILYPMNAISMMCSIYMTMAIGMERYLAVYRPMEYSRMVNDASTHAQRLLTYIVPISICSVVFNIPKFLESKVVYGEEGIHMEVTELRMNTMYVTWYHNWARLMVLGIFPLLVICILNYKIYVVISQRRRFHRRKQDDNLSIILMIIILSFVLCNLLRVFLNMHEITVIEEIHICRNSILGGFPIWIIILGFVSHILLVINSSINLVIYCMFGKIFRQVFNSHFNCRYQAPSQDSLCSRGQTTVNKGETNLTLSHREVRGGGIG